MTKEELKNLCISLQRFSELKEYLQAELRSDVFSQSADKYEQSYAKYKYLETLETFIKNIREGDTE